MADTAQLPGIEDIAEDLAFFDGWEDRYRYIIELGRMLPAISPDLKVAKNIVPGCQSQVWIQRRRDPDTGRLSFQIDSDAFIVRGLIAILLAVFNNKKPSEILAFDVEAYLDRLGLVQHLSPTRGNGLYALIHRIRTLALAAETAASAG